MEIKPPRKVREITKELKKDARLKKAFWAALARLISVGLAAGAGSLLYGVIGSNQVKLTVALFLALVSFVVLCYVEYQRL